MSFLAELKRRNVLRAAALYIAASWLLVQVATTVFPAFEVPDWVVRALVIALAIGFPFWLLFAWLYELTPQGLAREEPASPDAAPEPPRPVRRKLDIAIFGVLLLAVALLLADRLMQPPASIPATATAEPAQTPAETVSRSIAVLPFENLSDDAQNAYFTDGMHDLILTRLADIRQLIVVSRTSTEKYKSHPDNLKQIAAELGVAHILEGSVQKHGNDVLINVQLIDARTDAHLWADSYRRTLDDIFGVEGEVAQKIADALRTTLTPEESARLADKPTRNPEAYDLFLRAEYFTNRATIDYDTTQVKRAIPLYEQAVAADPDFALGFARLSFAESVLAWLSGGSEKDITDSLEKARRHAEKALALRPDLPEARLAVGYCDYWGRDDYAAALASFDKALTLRPNDADALAARGYVLRRQGDFDDAITSLQQALVHDPRNSSLADELSGTYAMASRYPEAEGAIRRAIALDPENVNATVLYATIVVFGQGDLARAEEMVRGDKPQLRQQRATILVWQRRYTEAVDALEQIPDEPDYFNSLTGLKPLWLAGIYARLGDTAHAQALYRQGLAQAQLLATRTDGLSAANASMALTPLAEAQIGLGKKTEALGTLTGALKLLDASGDSVYEPSTRQYIAALYAQTDRPDLAVPQIERALASPGIGLSYAPDMLWIDPAWDPIRNDPAFKALQAHYADKVPVAVIRQTAASGTASSEAK